MSEGLYASREIRKLESHKLVCSDERMSNKEMPTLKKLRSWVLIPKDRTKVHSLDFVVPGTCVPLKKFSSADSGEGFLCLVIGRSSFCVTGFQKLGALWLRLWLLAGGSPDVGWRRLGPMRECVSGDRSWD